MSNGNHTSATRIELEVIDSSVQPNAVQGKAVVVPVICLQKKGAGGFHPIGYALVDTGAPWLMLPARIWSNPMYEIRRIPGTVSVETGGHIFDLPRGMVTVYLLDNLGQRSALIETQAVCGPPDWQNMPILLGLEDVLAKCLFHLHGVSRARYLDFS